MLHPSAVPLNLLQVLAEIQEKSSACEFALAGGTSLALRLGHRLSVDLDFFTSTDFTPHSLAHRLGFGPESITGQAEGTLQCRIRDVKVEFLKHAYPQLADHDIINGVAMWSIQDVAAMKLNAICNRGSKKDFYDIAALLEILPLDVMLHQYKAKYHPASLMMVVRSLAWFDDADAEPDPISLRGQSWQSVIELISSAIRTLD